MIQVKVDADRPAETAVMSFNRDFWQFEQALDLLDAIDLIEKQDTDSANEQVRRLINLYWFMSNISESLVQHGCVVVVSSN